MGFDFPIARLSYEDMSEIITGHMTDEVLKKYFSMIGRKGFEARAKGRTGSEVMKEVRKGGVNKSKKARKY